LNFFSSFLHFELKNDLDMEPDPDSLKRAWSGFGSWFNDPKSQLASIIVTRNKFIASANRKFF
jgi:hypothetical protein